MVCGVWCVVRDVWWFQFFHSCFVGGLQELLEGVFRRGWRPSRRLVSLWAYVPYIIYTR
jgi:hypothetical protein